MESEKNAETLEAGSLVSKPSQNEIFCSKIRDDGNPGYLSNVIEKCVVDAYSGRNELSNVELARKIGYRSIEESMVVNGIAGDNRVNEGSVNDYHNEKLPVTMHNNDVHNNDFPVFEGELKFSGNDEDQTAKVEEPVGKFDDILHGHDEKIEEPLEKGNDVFHPHAPGSPTKIEVSGNSINLFVEVFGPLDRISGSNDTLDHPLECKLGESNFKQELSLEENATLSIGVTDLSAKHEGEDIIGEQERTFDIGDLVWIKTRTQLWWPGMVSDPSSAPNDTTKCEKKGTYLAKYYGNASFAWCENADLKPFPEYFEQMSGQNSSRNFYGSVDRALCEIGQRVKLKMTCPCFSKDSQMLDAQFSVRNKEENFISMQKASKYDVLSLSQFQPAAFIADIRDLARSMHVPGKIELMVMKNRLVPFYRAIGHCELPLQLLRSGSDAAQNTQEHLTSGVRDENDNDRRNSVEAHDGNFTRTRMKRKRKDHSDGSGIVLDDKIASSAKGLESRERKKSKYLSYPYVDVKKGQENEDLKQSSNLEGSCSGIDSLKRGSKKPSKGHHIVSKADDISACSVELLAELCSSARDCFYISRSKYSDSLKRFYCSFRMFAFLDADIASKVDGDKQSLDLEKCPQGSAEAEVQMEGSTVVKKPKKQKASVKKSVENNVVGNESSGSGNQKAKEKAIGRRAKKKEEQAKNPEAQLEEEIRVVKESENQGVNLASSSLENADKLPNAENPQANENGMCWKTNKEKEKVVPAGLESVQSSFSVGTNTFPTYSWMISFQQACAGLFKSSKTPKKSEGLTSGLADTNSIPKLPDLNGNLPLVHDVHIPVGEPSTNLVNPFPEQRKEGVVSPTINGVHQMDFAFASSSSKDVPATVQNTPLSNNGATGPNKCTNGDFKVGELDPITMNIGVSPFVQRSLQMATFLSACKPEPKKRKRKEKTCQVASGIPDLNGNVVDMNMMSPPGMPMNPMSPPGMPMNPMSPPGMPMNMTSPPGMPMPEGSHIPPEGEPQKKRRYKSASGESGVPLGGNVILNFAPGCVPPKETLVATFSRFGLLKESELEVSADDSVKIVYERSSEARFAFRSLEKSHTFGESLLRFNLDSCSMPDPPKIKKKNSNLQLHTFVPCRNRSKPGEMPDIAFIKQNVEMMKSTLEKAGNNLSPEMRAKLENEIKAFLDKISSAP